jgi:hypothetical protein
MGVGNGGNVAIIAGVGGDPNDADGLCRVVGFFGTTGQDGQRKNDGYPMKTRHAALSFGR